MNLIPRQRFEFTANGSTVTAVNVVGVLRAPRGDGLESMLIAVEVGRAADFVFMDKAQHSAGENLLHSIELGDLPGIGMVVIDGQIKCQRSRNTPPATRIPAIIKG